MKKLMLVAALFASSLALASTWDVDTAHAQANFTVKHMMVTNVTGNLGDVKGTVEIDDKDITKSKVDVTIDVAGINTKFAKRDEHLRSPDFFDVAKFPTMTFKSTKVEKAGDKLKVTGDLTIKGITKPVTLDVELSKDTVENPFSKIPTRAASATGSIDREQWGLTWNKPLANNGVLVGKEVKLAIDVELTAKPAEKAATKAPEKKK